MFMNFFLLLCPCILMYYIVCYHQYITFFLLYKITFQIHYFIVFIFLTKKNT